MSRRARMALIVGGSVLATLVVVGIVAYLVLTSQWFHVKVQQRIVEELQRSTGGRVETGPFTFNWGTLQGTIQNLTIHGSEPPGAPPLLHARSLTVGLRVISVFKRQVYIQSLDVVQPAVYLIIHPDGSTNIPKPRVSASRKSAMETILDLAVKHFSAVDGTFTLEGQGKTPFNIRAQNLQSRFAYQALGPRYVGNLSASPLEVHWGQLNPIPGSITSALVLERNRILITRADLVSGRSTAVVSGQVTDLAATPLATLTYQARLDVAQWGRILKQPQLESGMANVSGVIHYSGPSRFDITGDVQGEHLELREGQYRLRDARAEAVVRATPQGVVITRARFAGTAVTPVQGRYASTPVHGTVEEATVRDGNVNLAGVRVETLGGVFTGRAEFLANRRYTIQGRAENLELRSLAALQTALQLPYNARVSGPVSITGSLASARTMAVNAQLTLAPLPGGPPVSGAVAVNYSAQHATVSFGQTALRLPHTQATISGTLGTQVRVHLETTDLNELTPLLAMISPGAPRTLPIQLHNGTAVFDGTVTGPLANPLIAGRLALNHFAYDGLEFDSFQSQVALSKSQASFQNASLAQGTLAAQLSASIGLYDWKPANSSPIAAEVQVRNAPIAEALSLAHIKLPAQGTLNAAARVSGTLGEPRVTGDLTALNGSIFNEPFNSISARLAYTGNRLEAAQAQVVAGAKQISLTASYQHAAGSFLNGVLNFEARSNAMPLAQIQNVQMREPGLQGTLQLSAAGTLVVASRNGQTSFRIASLNGDLAASGVQRPGQRFGDLRAEVRTQGQVLSASLSSDFTGAAIRGSGQWRLVDDYPGDLRLTFSQLNLETVAQWLAPQGPPGGIQIAGTAQGQADISGPLLDPQQWTAKLVIPQLQLGPAPGTQLTGAPGPDLFLHNSGPVVLTLNRSVITVQNARLMGRATDLTLSGTIALQQASPLDLKLNGRIDMAMLHDFDRDVIASGFLQTDATIRGTPARPQISGRLETKNAAINYDNFPTGLSNINAVLLFSGNGATIQNFTAESGGGTIRLTGFAGYEGNAIVFRLHANAREVRFRYPQGVSTVANASLTWTGTSGNSMVSGNVTVVRVGFNPSSDLGSVLATSSRPVQTPAVSTGPLAGIHLDINIQSAPDVEFQSSLAQDIVLEANLRLRGTAANPALLGRINVLQGQLIFFGTKYTIDQGSVSFFNPVRIEPILNVDLETRARGIDVILNVSGPPDKLALTPRSDPPLPFDEIIALLATGRAPTPTETGLNTSQMLSTETWQQMGASALLSEAVANPLAGRLQRFFGITKLRIDPTMPGVEFNPQARITIEQQITPSITFTYITVVTSSNPLVVQVEWAVNPRWSVIAVRDENGMFGMDFFYKKRFK